MHFPDGRWQQDDFPSTKFHAPSKHSNLLSRLRLIEELNAGLHHKLTLISAPAGFGKTTLLSEWQQSAVSTGIPVAWMTLDTHDCDPMRFWASVFTAISMSLTSSVEKSDNGLSSSPSPTLETLLASLLNTCTAISQDFALILDDFHKADATLIADSFEFFLDYLPPNMHLFLASRVDPPLPLARLRVQGQLHEVHAANLRFTLDETSCFFSQHLALSSDQVAALQARTEGWITGLQLAALSLQKQEDKEGLIRSFTGEHRFIADYLLTEVWQQQPERLKQFLLHTSLVDEMNAALCNVLIEREDGQALLEELEQANLFLVPLDEVRGWYRYHHLFRDFLHQRLEHDSSHIMPELHKRAANWYEQRGEINDAIEHFLAAQDFEHAAQLVEKVAESLMRRREIHTFLGWLTALPEEQLRSRPRLRFLHAGLLLSLGQTREAEQLLRTIEAVPDMASSVAVLRATIASMQGESHPSDELFHKVEQSRLGTMPELQSLLSISQGTTRALNGDQGAARQAFLEASRQAMEGRDLYTAQLAHVHVASTYVMQGKLDAAAREYQAAINVATARREQVQDIGLVYVGLGEIQYEWNDLEVATHSILEGIRQGEEVGNEGMLLFGYLALARVRQAQGKIEEAMKLRQQVEELLHRHPYPSLLLSILAAKGISLCLMQGDVAAAEQWAYEYGINEEQQEVPATHLTVSIAFARLLLAQNRHDEAEALLAHLEQKAEKEDCAGMLIAILVLQALNDRATGKITEALSRLARALLLAEPTGYMRLFVDEGIPIAELLIRLLKAPHKGPVASYRFSLEYASVLLSILQRPLLLQKKQAEVKDIEKAPISTHTSSVPSLLSPLSEREQEILRLIASGLSNQEIARKLILEKNTLKTHIRHLYRKLDVQSRTQALARARLLHLL